MEREHSEGDPLEEERRLAEQGNTDAKPIMPEDDEASDDDADSPPDQPT